MGNGFMSVDGIRGLFVATNTSLAERMPAAPLGVDSKMSAGTLR
jgi:hypothetical protein